MANSIFKSIAGAMPNLKQQLRQAGLAYEPEDFVKRSFLSSLMLSFGVCILFLGGMFKVFDIPIIIAFATFPFMLFVLFSYFLKAASVAIKRKGDDVNKEIVFATRFLIIEVESGVPIYEAFVNITEVYPAVGQYFKIIVESVNMGTSMEDAINETIEISPCSNLRKVLWQILNTISTGSDMSRPLNAVLGQIMKDQQIELQEYGRKLNPMAMFYMMVAVILPSLGTTMLIIFSTFTGFKLDLTLLLTIAGFIGFVQFMFYAFIKSSRPAVEL